MEHPTSDLYFLGIQTSLSANLYPKKIQRDKWDIAWCTTKERCRTILIHAMENTVVNTMKAKYAQRMMGRLDVIPSNIQRRSSILIGCIFYDMVQNPISPRGPILFALIICERD